MSGTGSPYVEFSKDSVLPMEKDNSVKMPGMFGGKRKSDKKRKMKGGEPMDKDGEEKKEEEMDGGEKEKMEEKKEEELVGGEEVKPIDTAFVGGKKSYKKSKGSKKKGGKKGSKKAKKGSKKRGGKKSHKKVKFMNGGGLPTLAFSEFSSEAAPTGGSVSTEPAVQAALESQPTVSV